MTKILVITDISFFKKLVDRIASTIACTLMTLKPHMMAYLSRLIEIK